MKPDKPKWHHKVWNAVRVTFNPKRWGLYLAERKLSEKARAEKTKAVKFPGKPQLKAEQRKKVA